jgi:hypothetical protein
MSVDALTRKKSVTIPGDLADEVDPLVRARLLTPDAAALSRLVA